MSRLGRAGRSRWASALGCGAVVALAAGMLSVSSGSEAEAVSRPTTAAMPIAAAAETVTVDGADVGRRFDGVGAITGHGATRLLYDYPEAARSQVLDYLFKPGYGASLQILKVEIGGDINATTGTTPSHMRRPGEVNCQRGHQWWLMKQAKQRNPDLKIAGLQWGAPGWFDGGFWSDDNIDYLQAWLDCAQRHGLEVDYMGGWNESGFEEDWFVDLDRALAETHPRVEIVAADTAAHDGPDMRVIEAMESNPAFKKAVDVVGWHSPCGNRVPRADCPVPEAARDIGKPLWASETSAQSHDVGAAPIARTLNRGYIDGKITAHVFWPAFWAGYGHQSLADTGTLLAQWPWSGHYEVGKSVWALAHTGQFTKPGWHYLETGSTRLDSGASVASLAAPSGADYSMVVETLDLRAPTDLTVRLRNLPERPLQVWSTDLDSDAAGDDFVHAGAIDPREGRFELRLEPGHVYTISTSTDGGRGDAASAAEVGDQMEMPLSESFDGYGEQRPARYFADVTGSFQTEPCAAERDGTCYEQVVTAQPIAWHGPDMAPTTLVGDPRWWGDYRASVWTRLDADTDFVELLARVDGVQKDEYISGYHLRLAGDGSWRLYTQAISGATTTLASGSLHGFDNTVWHQLALVLRGSQIRVAVDDQDVATVDNAHEHRVGGVGLRTSKWDDAQFDDLRVTPAGPTPRFVPHRQMSAYASSEQPGNSNGFDYPAEAAIDDRPESYWRSRWSPPAPPPQSITLDLGRIRTLRSLTYQPDIERPFYLQNPGHSITHYRIMVSIAGEEFRQVAEGVWPANLAATKVADLGGPRQARYVRLVAEDNPLRCGAGSVTAAEINVATTPIDDPTPGLAGDEISYAVPQSQMSATATTFHEGYEPGKALDDDCGTFWHSAFRADPEDGLVPQAITLDLGKTYNVSALSYLPRQDGTASGTITGYDVFLSRDGQTYTKVASGDWANNAAHKTAIWSPTPARYLRLQATAGANDVAAAAELHVGYQQ